MTCSKCGAQLRENARFCENCGAPVSQDSLAPPQTGSPVPPQAGSPVPPQAGSPVPPQAGSPVPPQGVPQNPASGFQAAAGKAVGAAQSGVNTVRNAIAKAPVNKRQLLVTVLSGLALLAPLLPLISYEGLEGKVHTNMFGLNHGAVFMWIVFILAVLSFAFAVFFMIRTKSPENLPFYTSDFISSILILIADFSGMGFASKGYLAELLVAETYLPTHINGVMSFFMVATFAALILSGMKVVPRLVSFIKAVAASSRQQPPQNPQA